ncbi:hypothetical protein I317_06179 [Kwoniella heveanensis CBS 569]|nr:hypothetical protein I317_06179 [Kwoniella heveanensis CBS 569]
MTAVENIVSSIANTLGLNGHSTSSITTHPLDPLSASEIATAVQFLKQSKSNEKLWFKAIQLVEPPKAVLAPWLDAFAQGRNVEKPPRVAEITYGVRSETGALWSTAEVLISSSEEPHQLLADTPVPAGQHVFADMAEMMKAEEVLLNHPEFLAVVKKFHLPETARVVADAWIYGSDSFEDSPRHISFMVYLSFSDDPDSCHYAAPLPVIPTVLADTFELLKIEFTPIYGEGDKTIMDLIEEGQTFPWEAYVPNEYDAAIRAKAGLNNRMDLKPYRVIQPEGAGFKLEGRVLKWQKWSFHIGFNFREGIVLSDLRYDGRRTFYRLSVSDMTVPYGDPRGPFHRKQAFDLGDCGAGQTANELALGCDCLGEILYLDFDHITNTGGPLKSKGVVCIHEQDDGIGWKHTNFRTGKPAVTRSRILIIQTIITVANYEYVFAWKFDQAAGVHLETRATGILSTCAILPGETSPFGNVVSPGVLATNHQHLFSLRIDPSIDGHSNTIYQEDSVAMPFDKLNPPKDNRWGVGYKVEKTPITTSGFADIDPTKARVFKIVNPNIKNPVSGRPVGYKLVPAASQLILAHPDSVAFARAEFGDHSIYVTSYKDRELFSGGDWTNQSNGKSKGIRSWIGRSDNVDNADVVLWHTFGLTHNPRVEDFPVMPCETHMVSLKPADFFTCSPAIDVPASTQAFNQSKYFQPASTGHFQGSDKVERNAKVNAESHADASLEHVPAALHVVSEGFDVIWCEYPAIKKFSSTRPTLTPPIDKPDEHPNPTEGSQGQPSSTSLSAAALDPPSLSPGVFGSNLDLPSNSQSLSSIDLSQLQARSSTNSITQSLKSAGDPTALQPLEPIVLLLAICRNTKMRTFFAQPTPEIPPDFLSTVFPIKDDLDCFHHCVTYSLSILVVTEAGNPWNEHIAPLFLQPTLPAEALKQAMLSSLQARNSDNRSATVSRALALKYRSNAISILRRNDEDPDLTYMAANSILLVSDLLGANTRWRESVRLSRRALQKLGGADKFVFGDSRLVSPAAKVIIEFFVMSGLFAILSSGERYHLLTNTDVGDELDSWWDVLASAELEQPNVSERLHLARLYGISRSLIRSLHDIINLFPSPTNNNRPSREAVRRAETQWDSWMIRDAPSIGDPRTKAGSMAYWHAGKILFLRRLKETNEHESVVESVDEILGIAEAVTDKVELLNWPIIIAASTMTDPLQRTRAKACLTAFASQCSFEIQVAQMLCDEMWLRIDEGTDEYNSAFPLIVAVDPAVPAAAIDALKQAGLTVRVVRPLLPLGTVTSIAERFVATWTKVALLQFVEYERLVLIDGDMMLRQNMDELFDFPLQNDQIAATFGCICNYAKSTWAPPFWSKENCGFTQSYHPTAITHPVPTSTSGPLSMLNSGIVVLIPSVERYDSITRYLTSSDPAIQERIAGWMFPDQDLLQEFFCGRWISLPWIYNAIKTMRYEHGNFFRDDEVRNLHYIVDKPWKQRPNYNTPEEKARTGRVYRVDHGSFKHEQDGVWGVPAAQADAVTHGWWWEMYEEMVKGFRSDGYGFLNYVSQFVDAGDRESLVSA